MYKKLSVFVLAVLTVQALKGAGPQAKIGGAADEAKELYYKLLEAIGNTITEANTTCNEALDALKQYATEIETDAKSEIQGVLDSFQAQMDEINEKAKNAGIDITECRKYEVQLSSLPDTLLDEIVACVNNQITAAQNQITDAMNRAQAIQQDFYNIKQEIDDCGSGWKAVACLAKLVVKIQKDTVEGPSKINTDVNNTITIVQNAWPEVKKCATDAVDKIPSQAGKIVEDFTVCAAIP